MNTQIWKIGLDFDGVIADTANIKYETAKIMYGVDIPLRKFKEPVVISEGILSHEQYRKLMNTVCGTMEVGMKMDEMDGAIDCLRRFFKGGHRMSVITSREDNEIDVARAWLKKRGIEIPFISSGYGGDKTKYTQGMDVYIDDDVNKLMPLVGQVEHLFLYTREYNIDVEIKDPIIRVGSWQEFEQRLRIEKTI